MAEVSEDGGLRDSVETRRQGGIVQVTGDGDGEWTAEKCSKRLSMLHRKLRQVKDLCVKQFRDPDSLDAAQLVKISRKDSLKAEIAELESLRRKLDRTASEKEPIAKNAAGGKARLPPGPFAAGGAQETEVDGVRYTADGHRLASSRKRTKWPPGALAEEVDPGRSSTASPGKPGDSEGPPVPSTDVPPGESDADFRWDEGFEDMEQAMETGDAGISGEPSGVYPKRLSSVMSYCRVSTKSTCEALVALGRVTVNGETVTDQFAKVDVLRDKIVCDGVAVTLPPKIDNSDLNKRPRDDIGKRTGPIPKAEKNTWKSKVKYRWQTDDGLLARRTRSMESAKGKMKQRGFQSDWSTGYD